MSGDLTKSRADRRELGIRPRHVTAAVRQILNDPDFEPGTKEEFVVLVLETVLRKAMARAKEEHPGVDWDALFEWAEKLIGLLIGLSGGLSI